MIMPYALVLSHAWTRERTNILRRAADASLHNARVSRALPSSDGVRSPRFFAPS